MVGGEELYLNHIKFRKDNHAEKIRKIFDEKMANLEAPVPRPTWAHTYDFNCTYIGARLIDGECKGRANQMQNLLQIWFSSSTLLNSLFTKEVHFQC